MAKKVIKMRPKRNKKRVSLIITSEEIFIDDTINSVSHLSLLYKCESGHQITIIRWNLQIMDKLGMSILSIVQRTGCPFFGGRNVLGAGGEQCVHYREVVHSSEYHYQRFYCS